MGDGRYYINIPHKNDLYQNSVGFFQEQFLPFDNEFITDDLGAISGSQRVYNYNLYNKILEVGPLFKITNVSAVIDTTNNISTTVLDNSYDPTNPPTGTIESFGEIPVIFYHNGAIVIETNDVSNYSYQDDNGNIIEPNYNDLFMSLKLVLSSYYGNFENPSPIPDVQPQRVRNIKYYQTIYENVKEEIVYDATGKFIF